MPGFFWGYDPLSGGGIGERGPGVSESSVILILARALIFVGEYEILVSII
jgi:hypothetical protein